jgi:hypothetical protein
MQNLRIWVQLCSTHPQKSMLVFWGVAKFWSFLAYMIKSWGSTSTFNRSYFCHQSPVRVRIAAVLLSQVALWTTWNWARGIASHQTWSWGLHCEDRRKGFPEGPNRSQHVTLFEYARSLENFENQACVGTISERHISSETSFWLTSHRERNVYGVAHALRGFWHWMLLSLGHAYVYPPMHKLVKMTSITTAMNWWC